MNNSYAVGWKLSSKNRIPGYMKQALPSIALILYSILYFVPAAHGEPGNCLGRSDYEISFQDPSLVFSLSRHKAPLVNFPLDGLQLGVVNALSKDLNYDPYQFMQDNPSAPPPAGLRWLSVIGAKIFRADKKSYDVALTFQENRTAILQVECRSAGQFKLSLIPDLDPSASPIAFFRLRPTVGSDEAFYGLGEYFDEVNHRGKTRAMQMEIDLSTESMINEAHVPIPFLLSTRGWGLFVECMYPGLFDLAKWQPDRVDVIFGTGLASPRGLTFYLFAARHPLDLTRHYHDITGAPRLPARWALGPIVWRNENRDQAQVEADIDAIRNLDLATNALWIDRPYATEVNTFDFSPIKFTNPSAMLAKARQLGLRMALWHAPYVAKNKPSTAALHEEAVQKGYFPPVAGTLYNQWSAPIDFTNPDAVNWWQSLLKNYTDMGIEGFKLDYAEDVTMGLNGSRSKWLFYDGSNELAMHSAYQLYYHKAYADVTPKTGGFILARAGTYGSQKNTTAIWPGDLDASFTSRGEVAIDKRNNKSYLSVGGFPASIVAGLTLGPSGFPFYGADTGGYRHAPPDKELFTRWFQQTALSPVMQVGTGSSDVPWEANPANGFDEEMLDWYRVYARLHLRLFPYMWTYVNNVIATGRPIQRPIGLAYPQLMAHPSDQYLLGDNLLVAPVVRRGEIQRTLTLPPGSWIDWWTGISYSGEREITVDAPLERLPLLMRSGSLIPMLRRTIDTMAPTTAPDRVDSYATTPGVLWVRTAPGPEQFFAVFDGTKLLQRQVGPSMMLFSTNGREFKNGVIFEVIGFGSSPSFIKDNLSPLTVKTSVEELEDSTSGWFYSTDTGGTVYIKVGSGTHIIAVSPATHK